MHRVTLESFPSLKIKIDTQVRLVRERKLQVLRVDLLLILQLLPSREDCQVFIRVAADRMSSKSAQQQGLMIQLQAVLVLLNNSLQM